MAMWLGRYYSGQHECHASTGAWSELSFQMITLSFVAGLSQVRPERLIETSRFGWYKQRQVDVLTKSSLRLPINCTVVYIHKDFGNHERDMESYGMTENRSEENRMEEKEIMKRNETR